MNCIVLLFILLCCQNQGGSCEKCKCESQCHHHHHENNEEKRPTRSRESECGCRDEKPSCPQPIPRPFPTYPGGPSTCGCEEP